MSGLYAAGPVGYALGREENSTAQGQTSGRTQLGVPDRPRMIG